MGHPGTLDGNPRGGPLLRKNRESVWTNVHRRRVPEECVRASPPHVHRRRVWVRD